MIFILKFSITFLYIFQVHSTLLRSPQASAAAKGQQSVAVSTILSNNNDLYFKIQQ